MQIIHEEFRKLIQYDTDGTLKPYEKHELHAHLETCAECQAYASSMNGMESILRPLLQKKWNQQPTPLPISVFVDKKDAAQSQRAFMATRKAAIMMICVMFVFGMWQFTLSNGFGSDPVQAAVRPIPTPSTQFTVTAATLDTCENRLYIVRENDTLERVAAMFSVSKQEIVAANNLKTENLNTAMEITIPICTFTPTGTVDALTTTYTPSQRPITSTPGG